MQEHNTPGIAIFRKPEPGNVIEGIRYTPHPVAEVDPLPQPQGAMECYQPVGFGGLLADLGARFPA